MDFTDAKNIGYSNFVIGNEIANMYDSLLDMQSFFTIDNELQGTVGMEKRIHVYSATSAVEKLDVGDGNTKSIAVSYAETPYKILLAQSRFEYYDEEEMNDENVVPTGLKMLAADLFNEVNKDAFTQLATGVPSANQITSSAFDFGAFVDAAAAMNVENLEEIKLFGFVSPKNMALVRKALKDDLKYVEAFARNGYVGTVAGINLYTRKYTAAEEAAYGNKIFIATKEAVTIFNKKGVEVESVLAGLRSETAANVRLNTILARKYYLAALTHGNKAASIELVLPSSGTGGTGTGGSDTPGGSDNAGGSDNTGGAENNGGTETNGGTENNGGDENTGGDETNNGETTTTP